MTPASGELPASETILDFVIVGGPKGGIGRRPAVPVPALPVAMAGPCTSFPEPADPTPEPARFAGGGTGWLNPPAPWTLPQAADKPIDEVSAQRAMSVKISRSWLCGAAAICLRLKASWGCDMALDPVSKQFLCHVASQLCWSPLSQRERVEQARGVARWAGTSPRAQSQSPVAS
jgi:hypothetical protein